MNAPVESPAATGAALRPLPVAEGASWIGFRTLLYKESLRFWKVSFQTIAAPVLTGVLYLLVFGHVLDTRVEPFAGVHYSAFLIPGLVMMSILQNAFANSSSSLIQSKIMGNLVFLLLPPLSALQFFGAYVLASVLRGLAVGLGVLVVTVWFAPPPLLAPLWIPAFALAGAALLGVLGLIAGIVSDKFDQLAAFQNFLILPATFLSGVFYSVHGLPPFWQAFSRANPFFYMIDGFRYGFFAQSDVPPLTSLLVVAAAFCAASAAALALLSRGYKLRS
jgi:ABC-2 type transport system permease protein